MARRKNDETSIEGRAQSIVSTAVGAAEALSVGVLHLTERTVIEALHAVEDIGGELGSAVVRAARGSIKAAEDIGGDLVEVGKGVSRGVTCKARWSSTEARWPLGITCRSSAIELTKGRWQSSQMPLRSCSPIWPSLHVRVGWPPATPSELDSGGEADAPASTFCRRLEASQPRLPAA